MTEVKLKPVRVPRKKFRILFDYGTEGYQFHESNHDSVDEAVKSAVGLNYSTPFIIVKVYWQPK